MVQDPELNNRNCRDHDPNREVNLHSHCVAVKIEDPGHAANNKPITGVSHSSMKASIFRLSVNMVTSHDQSHARKS